MSEQGSRPDGQRIADELAQIRELLSTIASALFEIAAKGEEDGEEPATYMDGTPRR